MSRRKFFIHYDDRGYMKAKIDCRYKAFVDNLNELIQNGYVVYVSQRNRYIVRHDFSITLSNAWTIYFWIDDYIMVELEREPNRERIDIDGQSLFDSCS